MLELPELFLNKMQNLFFQLGWQEQWSKFLHGIAVGARPGLRVNTNKVAIADFFTTVKKKYDWEDLKPIPWTLDGFYLPAQWRPAQVIEFLQGQFYLQEASAMLPAAILQAKPHQKILDLCAAPGGKSTKIVNDMLGQGLVICNELSVDRARVLLRNLEQWGSKNVILTNADALSLPTNFTNYFDKILVDAPCSGEGMFGRDSRAVAAWTTYQGADLENLQLQILTAAAKMLKAGGELLYSTCTFNPGENEGVINSFLEANSDFYLLPIQPRLPQACPPLAAGLDLYNRSELINCCRIWPHLQAGEGHFCALLAKKITADYNSYSVPVVKTVAFSSKIKKKLENTTKSKPKKSNATGLTLTMAQDIVKDFISNNFTKKASEEFLQNISQCLVIERNFIHWSPPMSVDLNGLHILKRGFILGEVKIGKKIKFYPAHAFSLVINATDYRFKLELGRKDQRLAAYVSGQSLVLEQDELEDLPNDSYILITNNQQAVGFAYKSNTSVLKNLYPLSWQRPTIIY